MMRFNEEDLIGKRIAELTVDGCGIVIVTEDGFVLDYSASDGGYSTWDVVKNDKSSDSIVEGEMT